MYLEPVRVLVPGPHARLGVKEEGLLVLLADVVVQILREGKLAMELLRRDNNNKSQRNNCPFPEIIAALNIGTLYMREYH